VDTPYVFQKNEQGKEGRQRRMKCGKREKRLSRK
jgi:hypothetical protein